LGHSSGSKDDGGTDSASHQKDGGNILNAVGGKQGTSKTGLRLNTGLPCQPQLGNCSRQYAVY
jgi:hypothetical protein